MRELSIREIKNLARLGKRRAIENFLMTVHHNDSVVQALMNLKRDARLYKWDHSTVEAIKRGIALSGDGEAEYPDGRK